MALPIRGLAAQQLHVRSEHGIEEGVGATEPDPHHGGRGDVGVAVFLQPRHETCKGCSNISRSGCTDHLKCNNVIKYSFNRLFIQFFILALTEQFIQFCKKYGKLEM